MNKLYNGASLFRRKNIFRMYIYSLPFSFAFSFLEGRITFTLLISALMLLDILIFTRTFRLPKIGGTGVFLSFLFLVYIVINSLININFNSGYLNHFLSYISSVLLFFIVPLLYFTYYKLDRLYGIIFTDIIAITLISSLYGCSQFILNNYYGINLDEYLFLPFLELRNTTALNLYFRTKSFFAEPGHFALFLECFIPIIYWYLFKHDKKLKFYLKIIIFLIILVSFILTISAAGFICLFTGVIIVTLLNLKYLVPSFSKLFINLVLFLGSIFLIVSYSQEVFPIEDIIITNTIDKFDSGSSEDRLDRLKIFYSITRNMNIGDFLFGYGPNATKTLDPGRYSSIVLLYPLIFIELGLIGLVIFLSLICSFIISSMQIRGDIRYFIQISLISVLLHYLFIAEYWYPYLWFIGIMISIVYKYEFMNKGVISRIFIKI